MTPMPTEPTEPTEPITDQLLAELEKDYTGTPVPPCRVCGAALAVGSSDKGRVSYHCSTVTLEAYWNKTPDEKRALDRHYRSSEYVETAHEWGDKRVIALIADVRRLRQQAGESAT